MSRLPFSEPDPDPTPPPSATPRQTPPISVSQLAGRIKAALTDGIPGKVRVVGEISNLSDRNHWFFSLKDQGAAIRCVCFASSARRIRFPVRDGMEVVATGRVDFYDAQGNVQLYVDSLAPVGEGALEAALRQLIAELREQGYFADDHKLPLPVVPRRVAVVTSRSAAALQDVINTAHRRWPGFELLLVDVRVQGEDAAPQIASALRQVSRHAERLGIDAVILTRGGGSIEDLWAFNERAVADAVYDSRVPIVAAIGHETDTTVAELVADARCSTPTQAAMAVVPERAVLMHQVAQARGRLARAMQRQAAEATQRWKHAARLPLVLRRSFETVKQRLAAAERRPALAQPQRLLASHAQRLAVAAARLEPLPARAHQRAADRLDRVARHLEAVSPPAVLKRGYTYTTDGKGALLRSAADAKPGAPLQTVFHDGKVTSTVAGPARRAKPRKARPAPSDDEPTLF